MKHIATLSSVGWILAFGSGAPWVGRAQVPPDGFNPNVAGASTPFHGISPAQVNALAVQPDGRLLVAGFFATLGGQPCQNFGRVYPDGSVDFTANANAPVSSLVLQRDGKIVVGGSFSRWNGQTCTNLARLNADGTLDPSFNPQVNGVVHYLAAQADGRLLVGGDLGSFTQVGGVTVNHLARISANGAVEPDFHPALDGLIAQICCLAVQPDGKILVGGEAAVVGTTLATNLIRLNPDGSLDPSFQPVRNGSYSFPSINCLALQPDGKIVVGGWFSSLAGQARLNLGRVNADGTLDESFNADTSAAVMALALQENGKILVGGSLASTSPNQAVLVRLNPDGTLDYSCGPQLSFAPPPGATLYFEPMVDSVVVQGDGRILVGGVFTGVDGLARGNLARLVDPAPATNRLEFTDGTLTWFRGGAGPELLQVSFDEFAQGSWRSLGQGTRVAAGWRLTNVFRTPNGTLRARGAIASQCHDGSGCGCLQALLGPVPAWLVLQGQPGALALRLSGELGRRYSLETSPTLGPEAAWQGLTSLWLTNNPQLIAAPLVPGAPQQFFRAQFEKP